MKRLLIAIFIISVITLFADYENNYEVGWDYSLMRMQKQSLFGSVPSEYKSWLGFRGYGFGKDVGYLGSVFGTRFNNELYVPEWLSFLGSRELWRYDDGDKYYRYKVKFDIVFDNFIYISLDGLKKYPDDARRWLFWETNILLALR